MYRDTAEWQYVRRSISLVAWITFALGLTFGVVIGVVVMALGNH